MPPRPAPQGRGKAQARQEHQTRDVPPGGDGEHQSDAHEEGRNVAAASIGTGGATRHAVAVGAQRPAIVRSRTNPRPHKKVKALRHHARLRTTRQPKRPHRPGAAPSAKRNRQAGRPDRTPGAAPPAGANRFWSCSGR
ncbi:hypothetical protein Acsp04_10150 [Actinomadura sp. NBRC 104425]|nr:hypothetical protein Acsp04_10150 [Actinomadura sp. NBRC 104425]